MYAELIGNYKKQRIKSLYVNILGQVVFSSINLGTGTRAGGRLATKALLKAIDAGIGRGVTSLFPIVIFKLKDGVSFSPGDPNYDLKQLAIESLSKRIYPNFVNCDFSQAHEDPNNPDTFFATMGK